MIAAPTQGEATQAFIDLLARARRLTPDLSTTMLPVPDTSDIERFSFGKATMIPILSTLLLTVADMRNKIAALSSALIALDTHARTLPTFSQV